MRAGLSPKELARAVGVSESSLKRWADEGRVAVHKTAGGHRRIPLAEALRFIREARLPVLHPAVLGLPELVNTAAEGESDTPLLFDAIKAGDAARTRGLLVGWYLDGRSIAAIADGPIRGAMEQIGLLWEHNSENLYVEHRATDIMIAAVQHLRALLPAAAVGAPVAVGGGGPEDPYVLPTLTAAMALTQAGYDAMNLGPRTPLNALALAARRHRAKLVWLSLSVPEDAHAFHKEGDAVARAISKAGAKLVIGGRAADDLAPPAGVHTVSSMGELVAFARGLGTQP